MSTFYLCWPLGENRPTPSGKTVGTLSSTLLPGGAIDVNQLARRFPLPWSAYVELLSVKDQRARYFDEQEALRGRWSVLQLDCQIESQFYERTALLANKAAMLRKGQAPRPSDAITTEEAIKDPYVLKFLDLKDEYSESHADAGQMRRYLNYAREHWMRDGENPPVGLIRCTQKDAAVAKYAQDGLPSKVLAAEYRTRD